MEEQHIIDKFDDMSDIDVIIEALLAKDFRMQIKIMLNWMTQEINYSLSL